MYIMRSVLICVLTCVLICVLTCVLICVLKRVINCVLTCVQMTKTRMMGTVFAFGVKICIRLCICVLICAVEGFRVQGLGSRV